MAPPQQPDGHHYELQRLQGTFDPWACVGLHADDSQLSARGIRLHVRTVVMKHVFERGAAHGVTRGPNVPTWQHVNLAKESLMGSPGTLDAVRARWRGLSVQTWNPYHPPGSKEALQPLNHRRSKFK